MSPAEIDAELLAAAAAVKEASRALDTASWRLVEALQAYLGGEVMTGENFTALPISSTTPLLPSAVVEATSCAERHARGCNRLLNTVLLAATQIAHTRGVLAVAGVLQAIDDGLRAANKVCGCAACKTRQAAGAAEGVPVNFVKGGTA